MLEAFQDLTMEDVLGGDEEEEEDRDTDEERRKGIGHRRLCW